ncbi:MAG: hypothetical protein ABSG32_09380 [Terriglobia bacterium]|jgi:hypothetical protein
MPHIVAALDCGTMMEGGGNADSELFAQGKTLGNSTVRRLTRDGILPCDSQRRVQCMVRPQQ